MKIKFQKMAILVDNLTRALIQGITGKEGSRVCGEMTAYGTKVVAGVTPGKGGSRIENVPIYNTVKDALYAHPEINISLVTVPAAAAKDAVLEAVEAGIKVINILTENVASKDSAYIVAKAAISGAKVIGPSSVGVISPGKGKVGSIGSGEIKNIFTPGPIGIISKSGGMTAEPRLFPAPVWAKAPSWE
jgi:succinyl-CoA synthetase alpha subunit